MTITRAYGLLWVLAAFAAGALYVTGSFSDTSTMILGFFVHALAGVGLLTVFPAVMTKRVSSA